MKLNNINKNEFQVSLKDAEEIKRGNVQTFKKVFQYYWNPLVSFSYRYVRDLQLAENIVQDIFLNIWNKKENIDPSRNFKTYLFTSVKNLSLNFIRNQKNNVYEFDELVLSEIIISSPEDEVLKKELVEAVNSAINELPERCKLIFSMNRFEKLTYKEIAEVLEISVKTVEAQMGKALKSLRKSLQNYMHLLFL